jgi:hypothetical protein
MSKSFEIVLINPDVAKGRFLLSRAQMHFTRNKDSHETILSKENMSLRVACLFSFCAVAFFSSLPDLIRLRTEVGLYQCGK